VSVQDKAGWLILNNLKSDVAVKGLHESFLKGYFKHYIIGYI
jgi:hypothetical protein